MNNEMIQTPSNSVEERPPLLTETLLDGCREFLNSFRESAMTEKTLELLARDYFTKQGLDKSETEKLVQLYFHSFHSGLAERKASLTVQCLGPSGSFTHLAAMEIFRGSARYRFAQTTKDIFNAVRRKECDLVLLAVHNSTTGPRGENIDLLYTELAKLNHAMPEQKLTICGEHQLKAEYCILSNAKDVTQLQALLTHPNGKEQCRESIERLQNELGRPLQIIQETSTSSAAKRAADDSSGATGAIAHRLTAELLELNILRSNVQDQVDNTTRFLQIGRKKKGATGNDRTSLWLRLKDRPGQLEKALSLLNQFNITNLISRPISTEDGVHSFFIELEGHEDEPAVNKAIESIDRLVPPGVDVLGSYPKLDQSNVRSISGLSQLRKPNISTTAISRDMKTNRPPLPHGIKHQFVIGIVGNMGEYGKWFTRFFEEEFGYEVIGSDAKNPEGLSNEDVVTRSDVVLFTLPLDQMSEVIRSCESHARENQLWMDIASVKGESVPAMLTSAAEVISLHPMFGPDVESRGQKVLVCPVRCPEWLDWCKAVLKHSEVEMEFTGAEAHDRRMAAVQALPHALHYAAAGVLQACQFDLEELKGSSTPLYSMMWYNLNRFLTNAPELCADIQVKNDKFSSKVLQLLIEELQDLARMVEANERTELIQHLEQKRSYIGEETRKDAEKRFRRLTRVNADFENKNCIEIFKEGDDRHGLLLDAVKVFDKHKLNMTSLHSEKDPKDGYHFLIGTLEPRTSDKVQAVIEDLQKIKWTIKN
ncbi:MAG: prephenate dehydrogenase/arogenate dehydrogenase family protein [Planctomycetota bacterium]